MITETVCDAGHAVRVELDTKGAVVAVARHDDAFVRANFCPTCAGPLRSGRFTTTSGLAEVLPEGGTIVVLVSRPSQVVMVHDSLGSEYVEHPQQAHLTPHVWMASGRPAQAAGTVEVRVVFEGVPTRCLVAVLDADPPRDLTVHRRVPTPFR